MTRTEAWQLTISGVLLLAVAVLVTRVFDGPVWGGITFVAGLVSTGAGVAGLAGWWGDDAR